MVGLNLHRGPNPHDTRNNFTTRLKGLLTKHKPTKVEAYITIAFKSTMSCFIYMHMIAFDFALLNLERLDTVSKMLNK